MRERQHITHDVYGVLSVFFWALAFVLYWADMPSKAVITALWATILAAGSILAYRGGR